jgi:hypothetical protein
MTTDRGREEFLQALKEHPEWREEIRKEILGEELLRLPVEFQAFVKRQEEFNARQEEFNARQEEFNAEVLQRFEQVDRRFEQVDRRFEQVDRRFDNIDRRLDRMEGDNSTLKSQNLEARASQLALLLCARLDCGFVRTLETRELFEMTRDAVPSLMNRGERESFINADLVVETEDKGVRAYITAEISFTGAMRDYQRAQRNSAYLRGITGRPVVAAIVSVRNDNEVQELVDAGVIHWCQPDV